uniref:Transcription factor CBF/NF-Y/archaeal histone domain-containing protein n=1 Tax=Glossina morsitans morsitans TaxID=37546 RepID=A0A1B0FFG5_GLOMM
MASEDLFEKDLSEEIITTLEQETEPALNLESEHFEDDIDIIPNEGEEISHEETQKEPYKSLKSSSNENKMFQLPLTRIRNIMKLDPDLNIASHEAVFLVTRATELFIESLAREAYTYTMNSRKKTVQKQDVDLAIAAVDSLMFLDGAMEF